MPDKKTFKYELPLDGKLITSQVPAKIGPNFQQLTNLRYHGNALRGIGGMTKINTNGITTYVKPRSAIHFKKDQPAESHVVVEAWDAAEAGANIVQNTTAIPGTGDFSATSLLTPVGTSITDEGLPGKFSYAPDGDLAYCNGGESAIWGGTERELAGFINKDPDGTFAYDFTVELRNTKTTSGNTAPLTARSSGVDANTLLLCHFDNNLTDSSPTTAHTLTKHGTVTYTTTGAVFGTHRAALTTDAYYSIPDNADFDLSGGTFTWDAHVELTDLAADYSLYYHRTGSADDSFNILVDTNGAVVVRIHAGAAKQFDGAVDFTTADGVISADTDYHIEVVESGDNWYIFVDGTLRAYLSDDARAANYTDTVLIGYDGTYMEGYLDEYRLSNAARHTGDFEIPTAAYSTSSTEIVFYIASVRPLDGFKLYSGTANTAASTMTVFYWDGTGWVSVSSLVDGTSASSKSLAQTGTVTFTSTEATAKIKYLEGVLAYWYKVSISASAGSPALYYATVSTPMQDIVDIWDGTPRLIDSFQKYGTSYTDATLNVRENEYDSLNTGTFAVLDSLTTSQWFICGFTEKMSGVIFNFVNGKENSTASTVATVEYWDGADWASVGVVDDGTLSGNVSLGNNGAVTWQPPSAEYRQAINPASTAAARELASQRAEGTKVKYKNRFVQSINNDVQLYYYKFSFSKNLDAEVEVYHITGIPAQQKISAYKFPFFANDRLWLCSDQKGKKNSVICSADGSSSVFNGDDSLEFTFGDGRAITGAAWIFSSMGSSIYNVMLFFKQNETWALIGNSPEEWVEGKYLISSTIGCAAPHTIKVVDLDIADRAGSNRSVVVWQASDGIYMSDGRSPVKLSKDIDDKFDQRKTGCIEASRINDSWAGWDNNHKCYHWLWSTTATNTFDQEWVFDFEKMGWFQIDRGTKDIQCMIEVTDTDGNFYNYGFVDTGYMERMDYGNTIDGVTIDHTFWTGDMAPVEGSVSSETSIEYTCLIAKAETSTENSVSLTHYGDGNSTGETAWTKSPLKSGYTLTFPVEHHGEWPASIFHSFKVNLAIDTATEGFEPLYLYFLYKTVRDHTRDHK